jgi:NADH dehydrogenase/NADH:ubiquinone oxidoreductase subunit G
MEVEAVINVTIDGRKLQVPEGWTILEAARENGIEIPTLCYHEALEPYGACRLCVVELERGSRSQLVASCVYPCEEGAVVHTDSEMVRCSRRTTVELLMASSAHIPLIQELAAQMGVAEPRVRLEPNDCILCGLCARACKEIVGVSAISLVDRGMDKKVKTPFEIASRDCIGCGTCVLVCPTGAIKLEDIGEPKLVHHWASDFQVVQCRICGDHYLSPEPVTDYERLFAEETH